MSRTDEGLTKMDVLEREMSEFLAEVENSILSGNITEERAAYFVGQRNLLRALLQTVEDLRKEERKNG